jgi:hypothetical protein
MKPTNSNLRAKVKLKLMGLSPRTSRSPEFLSPIDDYKIVEFTSVKGETRFRVEDGKGKILADCRGFGFKSAEKAQNAFDYLCRNNRSYQELKSRKSTPPRAWESLPWDMLTPAQLSEAIRDCYTIAAGIDTTRLTTSDRTEYCRLMDDVRRLRTRIERVEPSAI